MQTDLPLDSISQTSSLSYLPSRSARTLRSLLFTVGVAFVLGAATAGVCHIAAGDSLGLFFGPVLLLTFLAPSMSLAEDATLARIAACVSLTIGVAVIWIFTANLPAGMIAQCTFVLGAYVLALAGAASLLQSLRLGRIFPAAAIVVIGFLWLTWPVWLCPWIAGAHGQSAIDWLTPAHPLMAMNAVLFTKFNFWDRYTLSYQQLTILNQDVLYTLPKTIAWMVMIHLAIAAIGFSPHFWKLGWPQKIAK